MIRLGFPDSAKTDIISDYIVREHITNVVVLSPSRFSLNLNCEVPFEQINWDEIIMYRTFYRLLQEISPTTLLVINECLRTSNRANLTYNCIRNYLTRTRHQIIFNWLPALESPEDFMILIDFDSRSRWRRSQLEHVGETLHIELSEVAPVVIPIKIETSPKIRAQYAKQKRSLIEGIGSKDPHTIPRQLHLLAGKHKAEVANANGGLWVGRNTRLRVDNFATYADAEKPRQVLEFCHSYRDWSDYLTASGATTIPALVSDLKVDSWYLERFQLWSGMQRNAYTAIRNHLGT